jgi:hypothetical protein
LAPVLVMKAFHHQQLAVHDMMCVVQQCAAHGQLGSLKHRRPPRVFRLAPLLAPFPVGCACLAPDDADTAAPLLAHGTPPQPLARATAKPHRGAWRAAPLAHRRREGQQLARECGDRMAPACTKAGLGTQAPQALAGPVDASGKKAPDLRGWRLVYGRLTKSPRGVCTGPSTLLLARPQGPNHTATDHRGQGPLVGEAVQGLCIGQTRDRQGSPTARQDRHHALSSPGTEQALERHRREGTEQGAPLHTQSPVRGAQGVFGSLSWEAPRAQDNMGPDGTDRFPGGTLQPPDRQPPEPHPRVMGRARQRKSPPRTGGMRELEATGPEKGDTQVDEGLALSQPVHGGGRSVNIADNGAVRSAARGRLLLQGTSPNAVAGPCAMPSPTAAGSSGVGQDVTGGRAQAGARGRCGRGDRASGSGIGCVCRSGDVEPVPRVWGPCPFLPRVPTATLGMMGATTKFGGVWY